MLPPIRYPLPTMVALIVLSLLLWRGESWTRSLRDSISARLARAVEGPPIPKSDYPRVVAGPMTQKALLLRDDVAVADTPGGRTSETSIRHRMFVDVYDVWPLAGEPTHYRVGNRRPIGWVRAADLLPWDTRLVIREPRRAAGLRTNGASPEIGQSSLPLLAWSSDALTVANWVADHPWSDVARHVQLRPSDLGREGWGVWLTREELLAMLRRSLTAEPPPKLRLRAFLGRLLDERPLSDDDVRIARAALPAPAFEIGSGASSEASDRLARVNEQWSPEASWGGVSFQFIPLTLLP